MKAPTRKQRILELLLANKGRRVPSPELARISLQYGSRVLELRAEGYVIRNEMERVNGDIHGYFTLEAEPDFTHVDKSTIESEAPRVLQAEGDGVLFRPDQLRAESLALAYETGRGRG